MSVLHPPSLPPPPLLSLTPGSGNVSAGPQGGAVMDCVCDDCDVSSATHGWDQKRVVTFTEGQQAQAKSPDPGGANAHPEGRKASPAPAIAPPAAPGASSSATIKADLHSPAKKQVRLGE